MHMHEEESGDSWSSLSSEEKKRKSKLEELDNMADGVGASLLRKMGYDGGGLGQREQGKPNAIEVEAQKQSSRAGIGLRERSAKAQGDFLFSESDFSDEKTAGGKYGGLKRAWDNKFRKAFGREKVRRSKKKTDQTLEFDANTTRSSKMSQRFCESFDEKYGEVLGEESAGSLRENEQGAPSHPPKRTNWKEFDAMSREQARPRKREKPDDMEELFRFRERNRNKTEAGAYQDKEFSDVSDKDESESNQSLEVKTEVKPNKIQGEYFDPAVPFLPLSEHSDPNEADVPKRSARPQRTRQRGADTAEVAKAAGDGRRVSSMKRKRNESPPSDGTRRKEKRKRMDQLPAREPQEAAEDQQVNLSDALKTCLPACLVYVNVLTAVDPHQSKPTYRPSHKTRTRCLGKRRKRRKRRSQQRRAPHNLRVRCRPSSTSAWQRKTMLPKKSQQLPGRRVERRR